MTDRRDAYLTAADSAIDLLARDEVAERWRQPSALAEWTVGGLAGHLASQVFNARRALVAPTDGADPIPLVQHYSGSAWVSAPVDDEVNAAIRRGGDELASGGPEELVRGVRAARDEVAALLAGMEPGAPVLVPWQGWALTLNDFLTTRMFEIAVHSDDLAVSVGVDTPSLSPDVFEPVLGLITEVAVLRHGQAAVLRAFTRSERAPKSVIAF